MNIDRKTQLGVILMLYLAGKKNSEVQSASILANKLCISDSYLQRISKPLCTAGLLKSHRGPFGGYSLTTIIEDISVGDVIRAMQYSNSDLNNSYSKENISLARLFGGLMDHLDNISLISLVSNKPTQGYQRPKHTNSFYLRKLFI